MHQACTAAARHGSGMSASMTTKAARPRFPASRSPCASVARTGRASDRRTMMNAPQSFQSVLDGVPNVVDYLHANPPHSPLNVFTVMMPADVVRPEFTTWRDEQRSWRETVALHDQSYHMNSLHVRGREAVQLFERLGVNSFATFEPGAAKQFVAVSPEGYLVG